MQPENNPIDDLFRNQLEGEQRTPPPGVWEEVRLHTQVDAKFKNTLWDHTVTPPSGIWRNIFLHLHPSKPFWLRPAPYWYAAASLLLFALLFSRWSADNTTLEGIQVAQTPLLPENTHVLKEEPKSTQAFRPLALAEKAPTYDIFKKDIPIMASKETVLPTTESLPLDKSIQGAETSITPEVSQENQTPPGISVFKKPSTTASHLPPSTLLSKTSEPTPNVQQNKAWMVSSLFSPDVNFGSGQSLGTALNESTQGRMQYSAGVRLGYAINERWSVQSGVLYSDRGQQLMPRGEQDNYVGNPSFMRVGEPVEIKAQIIDIPIVMRYKILGNKLRWFMHSGISANVTGGASSLLMGTGTEFAPGNGFSISVEPTWRRMVETLPNMRPNSVGILTGVNYRF
jgi:hypothetical protein